MEWISSNQTGESALLPQISISTITTTLKFNCKFDLHKIYKYVKLDSNNIIGFKCNGWVRIKLGDKIVLLPPAVSDSDSDDDDDEDDVPVPLSTEKKKKIPSHYNEIKGFYNNLKIKRSKHRFFNQVTAYIKLTSDRYINVKIFKKMIKCNIIAVTGSDNPKYDKRNSIIEDFLSMDKKCEIDFEISHAVKPTDFPDQNAASAFFAFRNV